MCDARSPYDVALFPCDGGVHHRRQNRCQRVLSAGLVIIIFLLLSCGLMHLFNLCISAATKGAREEADRHPAEDRLLVLGRLQQRQQRRGAVAVIVIIAQLPSIRQALPNRVGHRRKDGHLGADGSRLYAPLFLPSPSIPLHLSFVVLPSMSIDVHARDLDSEGQLWRLMCQPFAFCLGTLCNSSHSRLHVPWQHPFQQTHRDFLESSVSDFAQLHVHLLRQRKDEIVYSCTKYTETQAFIITGLCPSAPPLWSFPLRGKNKQTFFVYVTLFRSITVEKRGGKSKLSCQTVGT